MQDYLFAKLPIALIKCGLFRELKSSSVVVYNVLLSYADFNTGTCFPGIPTICDFSGLSRPTVIDAIKELEDWGLVEVTRRPGRGRRCAVVRHTGVAFGEPCDRSAIAPREATTSINSSIGGAPGQPVLKIGRVESKI